VSVLSQLPPVIYEADTPAAVGMSVFRQLRLFQLTDQMRAAEDHYQCDSLRTIRDRGHCECAPIVVTGNRQRHAA
jgi:hypothetical protein